MTTTADTAAMTLVRSARSILGSGQAMVDTYRDADGAEWTSLGGAPAVLVATPEEVARREARAAALDEVAAAVRGGAAPEEARALYARLMGAAA